MIARAAPHSMENAARIRFSNSPHATYRMSMIKNGIRNSLFRVCCALCAVAIAAIGAGFRASAQTPSTELSFEVATIKPVILDPAHPFDHMKRFGPHIYPDRASYYSMTPANLIDHVFGLEPYQVAGPEWTHSDFFNIEAKFPDGAEKKDERGMLLALLKDRFKLAFHIEKKEFESYVLVVGKHGQKLTPSLPDPPSAETAAPAKPGDTPAVTAPPKSRITRNPDGSTTYDLGKRGTQRVKFDIESWSTHYERDKITLEELANELRICVGAGMPKVVNETEIKGTYQLAWDCPSSAPRPRADATGTLPSDPQDGSLLTKSLDVLGLKLEKRKAPQDLYVIDHMEKPSEN